MVDVRGMFARAADKEAAEYIPSQAKRPGVVDDAEFEKARSFFASLPYPAFKMTEEDKESVQKLLPGVDIQLLEDAEVKAKSGACVCGRQMNLLDIVANATVLASHRGDFMRRIFSGSNGRMVISADTAVEDVRNALPENTLYVKDTAPIPCAACGRAQDLVLLQRNVLHYW